MKSIAEKTIKKYLPSLGVQGKLLKLKNLPALYQGMYDFEELDIHEKAYLVIKVKDKTLGPKDFKKHSRVFKESLDYPQIWYLKELHFNKVQRMIQNELNFIIEDKQVHLPSVNISIKHEVGKIKVVTQLSRLSVNMLIREILKGDLSGKNKVELAELFQTTKMTAGRAIEPLLANELCEESNVGVFKKIHFRERTELWAYLKENVDSPVKEVIYFDKVPKALPLSGISALSKQTLLAEDEIPTFASDKRAFNKRFANTVSVLEEFAKARIELWDRPTTLQENDCINVIDIYLVLKEVSDERVQIELEGLLNKFNLEI
ncbi:MAG: hypothetical protein A2417_13060 [Bdellovibrionales bacterium RIFOXYC1_FULL_37_79]|nr:MAG: hypothetical protein A2417_13060 [Bdellovibrionales bacterium RIFOXYC1_FULL_37_79]